MANKKTKIATFEDLKKRQDHAVKKPHGDQKVSAALDNFEVWLLSNWKQTLIGVGAFVVIVVVVLIAMQIRKANLEKIRSTFAEAQTQEALQAALEAHPDSVCADSARQRLAALLTNAGNLEKAIEVWAEIEASPSASIYMKSRAGMNRAALLEQIGKKQEALAAFQSYAQNAQATDFIRNEALFSSVRLLADSGDTQQALQTLDSILVGAPYYFEAKMLRDTISGSVSEGK